MKLVKRKSVIMFLAGICMMSLATVGVFPVFIGNYTEYAFKAGIADFGSLPGTFAPGLPNQFVKDNVARAAVYLLTAKSRLDNVMQMVEAHYAEKDYQLRKQLIPYDCTDCAPNKPDYTTICDGLECAINNVDMAITVYHDLVDFTAPDPNHAQYGTCGLYDCDMVNALANFDYRTFFAERVMNPTALDVSTCRVVEELLVNCNMNGVYKKLLTKSEELLERLICVKKHFQCESSTASQIEENLRKNNESIIIHKFWNINYEFTWIHMFGQHVSEVFEYIKNNQESPENDCKTKITSKKIFDTW